MPRLSEKTREQRRQHILASAWRCFSRDGFHATSIEDVIAATGMSSSAVYRYFRSKEEIIRASAEIGVERVGDIFVALLDRDPCPTPADALDHIVELATRWRDAGHIPADADTKAVAATIFSLMHGLIVMHHLVEDVP